MSNILPFLVVASDPSSVFAIRIIELNLMKVYFEEFDHGESYHALLTKYPNSTTGGRCYLQMEALAKCSSLPKWTANSGARKAEVFANLVDLCTGRCRDELAAYMQDARRVVISGHCDMHSLHVGLLEQIVIGSAVVHDNRIAAISPRAQLCSIRLKCICDTRHSTLDSTATHAHRLGELSRRKRAAVRLHKLK